MTLEQENTFKEKCQNELPLFIKVNEKTYRMNADGLYSGSYRIFYAEWNIEGNHYDWEQDKLIDMFYDNVNLDIIIEGFKKELNISCNGNYELIPETELIQYPGAINDNYKIDDVIFTIANGELIKTKIIKLYPNHVGVYSGEWIPYERHYNEIGRSKEQLFNKLKVRDLYKDL